MNRDAGGGASLGVEAVARRLTTGWLGHRHIHLTSCVSTNDAVAVEARAGAEEGLLITADTQTGGRGRLGRTWHSPPDSNLYMSLLLRPQRSAVEIPPLTLLAGGALAQAVCGLGYQARVKWPNDLLVPCADGRSRKVAGILTEATTEGDRIGHVVVGIGLNVNSTAATFPDELADKATSLLLAARNVDDGGDGDGDGAGGGDGDGDGDDKVRSGAADDRGPTRGGPLSRVEVLARILAAFEPAYERFQSIGVSAAIELWESFAAVGSRCRVRIDGREIAGVMSGVASDGALLIEEASGAKHRMVAGEVLSDLAPSDPGYRSTR